MQIPAALAQQPPATVAPAAATPFDTRAAQLVDLMTGKLAFADYFAPAFQHAVPEAQFKTITAHLVAQYGQPVAVESDSSPDGRQGKIGRASRRTRVCQDVSLSVVAVSLNKQ